MNQRLFKFEDITVADGDFSVKYFIPDEGTHQVLTRVIPIIQSCCHHLVYLCSSSPPSLLNPFPNTPGQQNDDGQLTNIKHTCS